MKAYIMNNNISEIDKKLSYKILNLFSYKVVFVKVLLFFRKKIKYFSSRPFFIEN